MAFTILSSGGPFVFPTTTDWGKDEVRKSAVVINWSGSDRLGWRVIDPTKRPGQNGYEAGNDASAGRPSKYELPPGNYIVRIGSDLARRPTNNGQPTAYDEKITTSDKGYENLQVAVLPNRVATIVAPSGRALFQRNTGAADRLQVSVLDSAGTLELFWFGPVESIFQAGQDLAPGNYLVKIVHVGGTHAGGLQIDQPFRITIQRGHVTNVMLPSCT